MEMITLLKHVHEVLMNVLIINVKQRDFFLSNVTGTRVIFCLKNKS